MEAFDRVDKNFTPTFSYYIFSGFELSIDLNYRFTLVFGLPLSNLGRGLRTRRGYPSESGSWSTAATSFLRRFAWPSCVLRTSWRTHVSFLQFVLLGHFLNMDSHTHIYRDIYVFQILLYQNVYYIRYAFFFINAERQEVRLVRKEAINFHWQATSMNADRISSPEWCTLAEGVCGCVM